MDAFDFYGILFLLCFAVCFLVYGLYEIIINGSDNPVGTDNNNRNGGGDVN